MKVVAATITDAQILLLKEAGAVGNIVAAAAMSTDVTRRYPHETIDAFHARVEQHRAARHDCAHAWNERTPPLSRDGLKAAIERGLRKASEDEPIRTMERSLLIDYITGAVAEVL
jgi:hypothetical protein